LKLQVALLGSPVHAILMEKINVKTDSIQTLSTINQRLRAELKQERDKHQVCLDKTFQIQKSLEGLSAQNEQHNNFILKAIDDILGNVDSMGGSKLNIDPYKGILQTLQIKKWDSRAAFKLRFDPLLKVMHKTELTASDLTSIKVLMNDYRNNKEFQIMHPQLYRHLVILNFWQRQFFRLQERLIGDLNNAPREPISSRQEYLQRKIDATDYLEFPSLEFAIKSAINDVNYKYIPINK